MTREWQPIEEGKTYHRDMVLGNNKAPDDEIDIVFGYQARNSGNHFYGYGEKEKFNATHFLLIPELPQFPESEAT